MTDLNCGRDLPAEASTRSWPMTSTRAGAVLGYRHDSLQKYTVRTRPEPSVLSHFVALDRAPDRLRGPERQYLAGDQRAGLQLEESRQLQQALTPKALGVPWHPSNQAGAEDKSGGRLRPEAPDRLVLACEACPAPLPSRRRPPAWGRIARDVAAAVGLPAGDVRQALDAARAADRERRAVDSSRITGAATSP